MLNQIINGDCFKELKKIKDNSIDLILTDPPYIISKKSNFKNSDNKKFNKHDIDFGEWDKEFFDINTLLKECFRVLKKGGYLIIFYDIWKCNDIKVSADKLGFKQPRVCSWVKTNPTPINSKINYLSNAVEYFFTFTKGSNPTFNSKYDNGIYTYPLCHGKERVHPTQKPLKLILDLVEKHSKEGDVILDPFAGSGTTGEAAKIINRDYILIEKELEYYNLCNIRLNKI